MVHFGLSLLDRLMGHPLLWFLARIAPAEPMHENEIPKRIIVADWDGLGSTVLFLPLLRELRKKGVKLAFWGPEHQADLVRASGIPDAVWSLELSASGFLRSLWNTWRRARSYQADTFICMGRESSWTAILAWLSGAPYRVAWAESPGDQGNLMSRICVWSDENTKIENYFALGKRLGLGSPQDTSLAAIPHSMHEIKNPFPRKNMRERVVLRINPRELSSSSVWPQQNWLQLCNLLLSDPTIDLFFVGKAAERRVLETFLKSLKSKERVHLCAGRTSILELLKLLYEADAAISLDTGFAELARWMNCPHLSVTRQQSPAAIRERCSVLITNKRLHRRAA